MCSFSILKIPHLPTNVCLDDLSNRSIQQAYSAARGGGGWLPRRRTCKHQPPPLPLHAPHFYRLLYKLMYVVCPEWAKAFLCTENDVQTTRSAFRPLPPPSTSHTTTFFLSSLAYLLTDLHPNFTASVTFYGDNVHTFFFLSFCAISLCPEVHRSTAGREISKKIRHLLLYMMELRISVPFRFRHFIVFYWMRCILHSFRNGLF